MPTTLAAPVALAPEPATPVELYTLAVHVFPESVIVLVRKESSGSIYYVRNGACDCPHYVHRIDKGRVSGVCKHQAMVERFLFHYEEPRATLEWPLPPLPVVDPEPVPACLRESESADPFVSTPRELVPVPPSGNAARERYLREREVLWP